MTGRKEKKNKPAAFSLNAGATQVKAAEFQRTKLLTKHVDCCFKRLGSHLNLYSHLSELPLSTQQMKVTIKASTCELILLLFILM